ncbi:MAG: prolipoprotein diacylglyceryl transferase [Candidatus Pacebacteria bacterium]|nr:prolipoprotein diacylglyceryl transferase [Candidatus Paceibacterota bacterium]
MINFLHHNIPERILFSLGPVNIYFYGVFMVLGILSALFIAIFLAKKYGINKDLIIDLAFYLIIGGIIGARLYELIIDFDYYSHNLLGIFKVWQGGLSIHGALIGGLIALLIFIKFKAKKLNINETLILWRLVAIFAPAIALGQAIGRWGNYFNQELFGKPTNYWLSIPIDIYHRPVEYLSQTHFHPTFLYESLGSLVIFIILILLHKFLTKNKVLSLSLSMKIVAVYLFLYSILRFSLEFIRIDPTLVIYGWRWPQIISIIVVIVSIFIFIKSFYVRNQKSSS